MFLRHKPSAETVSEFINSQAGLAYSYLQVGATQSQPPAGYRVDHNRIKLGDGENTFQRAVAALRSWRQSDLGWIKVLTDEQPIAVGKTIAVLAKTLGVWSLNAARIVYVIDERNEATERFGFAYGTLPDHVERGEERFLVERLEDGSVWYDLYAFSRPQHPLARLGSPITRMLQKRFARESLAAMKRSV